MGVRRLSVLVLALCASFACAGEAAAARLKGPLAFDRSGGIAGLTESLRLKPSGRARVDTRRTEPHAFRLTARERRRVEAAVAGAHPARVKVPKHAYIPDAFVYRIAYGGRKIEFDGASMPRAVRNLVGVLERLVASHT
jgi:hypothetical protein